tara:strand:+ start:126 stop:863 length:738 start_codon:yes stop_codon:yes gene_type:complete
MAQPVMNEKSQQSFNRLLPNSGLSKAKVPDIIGCFGNLFKFSYVISAPLHMKGFWQFWAHDHKYACLDRLAVTFDLLIHLGVWFIALALEIWSNTQENRGPEMLAELSMVSLWSLIVALSGILVAQAFAMTSGGQEAGKLFPTTYAAIVGGAYTSIIMSILWTIQSPMWTAMVTQYSDHADLDDNLKSQRHVALWTIALKTCAVVTLQKNASFWGPCVIDERKEADEKTAQWVKESGMSDGGYGA